MLQLNAFPAAFTAIAAQPPMVVLVLVLLVAMAIDLRTRRIPNWLTYGAAVAGLAFGLAGHAFFSALAGLAVGLAVMLPLHLLRVLGAGDVKLMAAVGAFVGPADVLYAALFTFIAGGVAAIVFALRHRTFTRMAANVAHIAQGMLIGAVSGGHVAADAPAASAGKLPYGLAIGAGTLASLLAPYLH